MNLVLCKDGAESEWVRSWKAFECEAEGFPAPFVYVCAREGTPSHARAL